MKTSARPRVIANFAITTDGKVSTRARTPSLFTSARDKKRLLEIRAMTDAVIVGRGTLVADTMSLRLGSPHLRRERIAAGLPPEPLRVVVTNSGRLSSSAKIFTAGGAPVVIFTGSRGAGLGKKLPPFTTVHVHPSAEVNLPRMLRTLREEYNVRTLLCEGGPTLFRSLLEAGVVDELYLTVAPVLFGGAKAPTLTGMPGDFLPSPIRWRLESCEIHAGEAYLHYVRRRTAASPRKKKTTA